MAIRPIGFRGKLTYNYIRGERNGLIKGHNL